MLGLISTVSVSSNATAIATTTTSTTTTTTTTTTTPSLHKEYLTDSVKIKLLSVDLFAYGYSLKVS